MHSRAFAVALLAVTAVVLVVKALHVVYRYVVKGDFRK